MFDPKGDIYLLTRLDQLGYLNLNLNIFILIFISFFNFLEILSVRDIRDCFPSSRVPIHIFQQQFMRTSGGVLGITSIA